MSDRTAVADRLVGVVADNSCRDCRRRLEHLKLKRHESGDGQHL